MSVLWLSVLVSAPAGAAEAKEIDRALKSSGREVEELSNIHRA